MLYFASHIDKVIIHFMMSDIYPIVEVYSHLNLNPNPHKYSGWCWQL